MKNKGFTLTEIIVVLVILAILAAFAIPTMLGYVAESEKKLCDVTRTDMCRLYETSLRADMNILTDAAFEDFVIENWGNADECPGGGTYTYVAKEVEGQQVISISCSLHDGLDAQIVPVPATNLY